MTSLKIENCDLYIKRHRGLKYRLFYNGPVIVSYTQRRKQTVFYLFVTFTSRENVLNENTVRTEGIQNHSIFDNEFYLLLNIVFL